MVSGNRTEWVTARGTASEREATQPPTGAPAPRGLAGSYAAAMVGGAVGGIAGLLAGLLLAGAVGLVILALGYQGTELLWVLIVAVVGAPLLGWLGALWGCWLALSRRGYPAAKLTAGLLALLLPLTEGFVLALGNVLGSVSEIGPLSSLLAPLPTLLASTALARFAALRIAARRDAHRPSYEPLDRRGADRNPTVL